MFTTEPTNRFFTVESSSVNLERRYTFGEGSFRQLIFGSDKIPSITDKSVYDSSPWIPSPYSDRLLAKVTDNYTSITLLEVRRTDNVKCPKFMLTNLLFECNFHLK